jgi:hypothetical protein
MIIRGFGVVKHTIRTATIIVILVKITLPKIAL